MSDLPGGPSPEELLAEITLPPSGDVAGLLSKGILAIFLLRWRASLNYPAIEGAIIEVRNHDVRVPAANWQRMPLYATGSTAEENFTNGNSGAYFEQVITLQLRSESRDIKKLLQKLCGVFGQKVLAAVRFNTGQYRLFGKEFGLRAELLEGGNAEGWKLKLSGQCLEPGPEMSAAYLGPDYTLKCEDYADLQWGRQRLPPEAIRNCPLSGFN
ncbi:MAG: hypothetical protein V4543_11670 [Bacteroidota bacterium]